MRKHESSQSSRQNTSNNSWRKLCGEAQRRVFSLLHDKSASVEKPDSERSPSSTDTSQHKAGSAIKNGEGQERVLDFALNVEEETGDEKTEDEEEVDVRTVPARDGSLVPGNVDENETGDT